ncbi:DNA-directed RNA polymerase I core subunit rpa12 [Tieghemiomyces parasiticus]|uniref:DNA-directed RNA polymerase subunit n=1 Tax=Tieghemiomyces parasiticus TaxID=78921 RepID=A0A9W7ZHG8_9FUNG|nr:DNA-directed RNA polymerase I core subunit rpa12 [Tieghemiomyces parasiticus]KAJ1912702.1 DNA-directed RNA polymerase I core subunit rpa12 [Tieghemiomyces parasiticus]
MNAEAVRNVYGSLVFCSQCGSLLDPPGDQNTLVCRACGLAESCQQFEDIEIRTQTSRSAFPSALRNKQSLVQTDLSQIREEAATIAQTCDNCGAKEMEYHTRQMRSADEGQTIFYNCRQCGYTFSHNS